MLRIIASIILVSVAGAPVLFGQKVRVDFDHDADFLQYRTYSWAGGETSPEVSPLAEKRIEESIDAHLRQKGLQRLASGGDLLVRYQAAVTTKRQLSTYTYGGALWGPGPGWGYGWGYGWGGPAYSTTTVEEIPIGTLVLDLLDQGSKQLVFRGVATDTLSSKPEKNTKKIREAVEEIFEKYPPKKKD